jgi:hypothetical protein
LTENNRFNRRWTPIYADKIEKASNAKGAMNAKKNGELQNSNLRVLSASLRAFAFRIF